MTLFRRIVFGFLVMIFFCFPVMGTTTEEWIKKVNALWDGKKYTDPKQAVKCWNYIIRQNPKEAQAYYNRGVAYGELRQYDRALKDYSQAIRLQSDFAAAYNNRAVIYLNRGDKKQGCADARKACQWGNCLLFDTAKGKGICR